MKLIPGNAASPTPPDRAAALDGIITEIGKRWGQNAIVRLGDVRRAVAAAARPRVAKLPEAPAWWPAEDGRRPRILEVVAKEGAGALTLSLTWLAAIKPTLAAFVDPLHRFYPPSAAAAGVPLDALIIVRPPAAVGKLAFDACIALMRSEAFDAIICPLPPDAKDLFASTRLASYLASLAARSGTSLLLVSPPHQRRPVGVLGSAADYRVELVHRRWRWTHHQLAGANLRVRTDRARAGEASEGVEHDLAFVMHDQFTSLDLPPGAPPFQLHSSTRLVPSQRAPHADTPLPRAAEAFGS